MLKPAILLTCTVAAAVTVGGCYSPSGGMMPHTNGPQTFWSTEMMQKTVTLIDLRTNEAIFTVDIPPGKQLVLDFDPGDGDDPVNTPDLLRWEMMDKGTSTGKLHNALTVPNAASRRLDVTLRRGTEYAAASPTQPLRTDQLADRPAWWTPEGGPMPLDKRTTMYDN